MQYQKSIMHDFTQNKGLDLFDPEEFERELSESSGTSSSFSSEESEKEDVSFQSMSVLHVPNNL